MLQLLSWARHARRGASQKMRQELLRLLRLSLLFRIRAILFKAGLQWSVIWDRPFRNLRLPLMDGLASSAKRA